ncbi:MAG: hypothetical protein M3N38_08800 [Pseudomonadota bacterium]|nr:hypothetical protein [Pseudomonadota bacterium]
MAEPANDTASASDIVAAARGHAPDMLAEAARLALNAKSETTRIAAIREVLTLAYGKAVQSAAADAPPTVTIMDDWARPDVAAPA